MKSTVPSAWLALLFLLPLAASAQELPQISESQMQAYAAAHLEIQSARNDLQAELARVANKTDEAQEEIRESIRLRVMDILEAHGFTEERFDAITFVLSVDELQQERFREILASGPPVGRSP
jgi:hypothetical protein